MYKMRLGWYAGVSFSLAVPSHPIPLSMSLKLTIMISPGLDGPCWLCRNFSLSAAAQLLLGHGLSCPEQLLYTGPLTLLVAYHRITC